MLQLIGALMIGFAVFGIPFLGVWRQHGLKTAAIAMGVTLLLIAWTGIGMYLLVG